MDKYQKILEQITSLVDGEISNKKDSEYLIRLIDSNDHFKEEYQIQKTIKNLVKTKGAKMNAPCCLIHSVISITTGKTDQKKTKE
ncbi:MAG: hypothetical protein K9J16_18640 [Melioribacteraceae bacterium]|nr:hypothetical protein [Melioribacteraceae bacterium]MCF8354431.1 hypothetical protein [Melioribacteraceae bacterium]MCF8394041.1 hypothetical protein [Melioribacteraceae bacterium]MCF8419807.1 hypothetical protein [Melioribacteraceae bacterium]